MKETTADAEEEAEEGVWGGGGAEGDGRCGEQLSADTGISKSRLVFWDVPCCSGISVNTEICLEWLYSSAGSLLSARTLKLGVWLRNQGKKCSQLGLHPLPWACRCPFTPGAGCGGLCRLWVYRGAGPTSRAVGPKGTLQRHQLHLCAVMVNHT